jgi:hypothetical protein
METFSGAPGVTDGAGGVTGFLLGLRVDRVGEGRCVGVWDGLADLEGEAEGDAETVGEGVALVSCEGEESLNSIGMTMSAPTTKNTAAMTTLESCIGGPPWVGARLRCL